MAFALYLPVQLLLWCPEDRNATALRCSSLPEVEAGQDDIENRNKGAARRNVVEDETNQAPAEGNGKQIGDQQN